jgi:hypothetical protein
MIDYVLEENRLTKDKPNDRYARVVNVESMTENDLAEAITMRNLGISKPEALAMLEAVAEIQLGWLADGKAINTRLTHFHFTIPGALEEGEYPTKAIVRVTPSKEVIEAAQRNALRHVEPIMQLRVDHVVDIKSGTTNRFITNGGSLKIFGHNLKVVGTNPDVGIEFIRLEDPKTFYPVPAVDRIINNPSELLILAPQMVSGESVQLKITTQYGRHGSGLLKTPRSVVFDKVFTVKD